jgi:hypothetical protein
MVLTNSHPPGIVGVDTSAQLSPEYAENEFFIASQRFGGQCQLKPQTLE